MKSAFSAAIGVGLVGLVTAASWAQTSAPPAAGPTAQLAARPAPLPDTGGSGPFHAVKLADPDFPGHVLYRPADLAALGKRKLAVLVWGNGGCSDDGASARAHLEEIASHGYLAIAPGSIKSGPGVSPEDRPAHAGPLPPGKVIPQVATPLTALTRAIDLAFAANARRGSPYYGRIDTSKIAVSGHSCGGLQALQAAGDPRVRAVVIHNSGVFADGSNPIVGINVDRSLLARLHTPILYLLGGPKDVAYAHGMDNFTRIDSVPVMAANLPVGHGGTFREQNGGEMAQVSLAWLNWQLWGDETAARQFTGKECGLCRDARWTVARKKLGE